MKSNEAFSLANLHPHMVGPCRTLIDTCRAAVFTLDGHDFFFAPFEGFRHPQRQYDLFARGKVTKAGPWQSTHQYGLAVDFACRMIDDHGTMLSWHWPEDAPWGKLKTFARRVGLDVPIKWDRGHVVHPTWDKIKPFVM